MSLVRLARVTVCLTLAGCGGAATGSQPPDAAAFVEAGARIEAFRAAGRPERTETVSLQIDAPYMPASVTARGAVAIRPPASLRMILIGPGGTTALDLWSHGDRYRFAIPALDRTLAGDAATPATERKGLPVDFLRWWMLRPLGGRLLAARREGAELVAVLADGDRITEARLLEGGRLRAHRTWWGGDASRPEAIDEEWLEASGPGCAHVVYRQRSTSLTVEARCEGRRDGAKAAAFVEPREEAPR